MTGEIRNPNKGHRDIPTDADPVNLVRNGELLVFRSALQEIDEFDTIRRNVLEVVQWIAGSETSRRLEQQGFEHLHELLNGPELRDINRAVKKQIRNHVPAVVKKFVRRLLGYTKPFYIGTNPMIRFFVPHDHYMKHRELFAEHQGSLKIQGPHHDEWFRNPKECLNIWMAIGRVQRGNGMVIYQDRWGDFIQHNGNREIPRDQSPGNKPINFSLNPGDVLVFHGAHLHTSELNRTDETRFVITSRFTTSPPTFSEEYHWRAFHDSMLINTPLSLFSKMGSYLSGSFLKRVVDKVQKTISQFVPVKQISDKKEPQKTKYSSDSPYREPVQKGVEFGENVLKIDASQLHDGEITPVSKRVCVLKERDSLYAFSRYCPHEGADLSNGFVDDQEGSIHCSWHNLCMDLQDGTHDCSSLSNLKTYPVSKLDENTYEVQIS